MLKVSERFEELMVEQEGNHARWEKYSHWTLPRLFIKEKLTAGDELQHDYQSVGAQAVNHLGNKLMIGLFGAAQPFFRMEADMQVQLELEAANVQGEVEKTLQRVEKESMKEMARSGLRFPLSELMKYLVTIGDCTLYMPQDKDDTPVLFTLPHYVQKRDLTGRVIEWISRDEKSFDALDEDEQEIVQAKERKAFNPRDKVKLYTRVKWNSRYKRYAVQQYVENAEVGEQGTYRDGELPFLFGAWTLLRGEDYGRGLVEEYAGDFESISIAEANLDDMGSMAAMLRLLVNPGGFVDAQKLMDAQNGEAVPGRDGDVTAFTVDKVRDMAAIADRVGTKVQRIASAFLMDRSQVRNAERVTAEEIRLIARDLETSIGGVYTLLADTLQLPVAKMLLRRVGFEGAGQSGQIEPVIITGLDALGRGSDIESWMTFAGSIAPLATLPEPAQMEINFGRTIAWLAAAAGLDQSMVMNSPDEKRQMIQQQQQMQEREAVLNAASRAAPNQTENS